MFQPCRCGGEPGSWGAEKWVSGIRWRESETLAVQLFGGASMQSDEIDPCTPVLAGVGQACERLGQPDYRRRSPVDLAADAARAALADTGADPAVLTAAIDTVAGVRQFEISRPAARAPLGRSANSPPSVPRPLRPPPPPPLPAT